MLLLESAMIGVFVSLDLLLFYLFFEASLVPMFFLIGIWGGERRIYAAVKFFIYTAVGSLLMLVGIIAIYFIHQQATGIGTFDYAVLMESLRTRLMVIAPRTELVALRGVCLCFLHQGAAMAISYLAAGCAHRSAHRRLSHSGWRAAEDGNLRIAALQLWAVP
jgi:NADH:ubiquinone oxidoreductase subunit 4 (subunit M)